MERRLNVYLTDPKTNKKSVSLTFLVASFILFSGFAAASCLGYVKDVNSLSELFYACAALYFGRRFDIKSKSLKSRKR